VHVLVHEWFLEDSTVPTEICTWTLLMLHPYSDPIINTYTKYFIKLYMDFQCDHLITNP